MRLYFLGGAEEIGASCILAEVEGHRVLIDAGIRMGAAQGENLPNFSVLDEVGSPEEVFVTHAHTDHSGALPVLVAGLSGSVPIRCTPVTKAIMRVLLRDALKIMAQRGEREGELPLYPPEAVDLTLARMSRVPYLSTVSICGGGLRAIWIPAGHILGAASIYIEGEQESLLVTGDVSVSDQQTIPGMVVPRCRPEVVVMESTYGNRQHADRRQQERALAQRVAGVIREGGKVLIPAFAVGRAQEVILILSRFMRRGQIPPFSVFVDGMVRSVNRVYANFPENLAPYLRRWVLRGEDPFYSENIRAISVPADRERVLKGPPCCIVASSGMLIGGASSFYAERLLGGEENLIAITGYQDEESPGRMLLALAKSTDVEQRWLTLNGKRVCVSCQVESYSLSAHADRGELASLVRSLAPRSVYLVHGDEESRSSLASLLDLYLPEGVYLPESGGVYTAASEGMGGRKSRYGSSGPISGISGGRPADGVALEEVRAYLLETGARGPFRVQVLAEVWHGSRGIDLPEIEEFKTLLEEPQRCFVADSRRPYLYHICQETEEEESGRMEMNEARAHIQETFPPEAGLYRCGAHVDEGVYELAFHFPDVAKVRYEDQIRELEKETGWKIRLRETPHQGRLFEEALVAVPEGTTSSKAPALLLERREVVVEVREALESGWEEIAEAAAERFYETTGYRLRLVRADIEGSPPVAAAPEGAWEINRAYKEIRRAFEGEAHQPYKVGLKSGAEGSYIEAAFISQAVGERYRELLEGVSVKIGWSIRVRESVNQERIAQEARRVTPDVCKVRGQPRFYLGERCIVVPVVEPPSEEEQGKLREEFLEATGFEISWEGT